MLKVGIVCEGPTDAPVLLALVRHLSSEPVQPLYLQPNLDALEPRGGGDTRVEAWCKAKGPQLEWLLAFQEIDLLLVHLDADRCSKYGAADTAALCRTVKGWLGSGARRRELIVVLPAQATEAWLVAAWERVTPEFEMRPHPEEKLAALGKLRRIEGRAFKDPTLYRDLASQLVAQLANVRPVLSELDRFLRKLETHPAVGT